MDTHMTRDDGRSYVLPSIATMTQGMPNSDPSTKHLHHTVDTRDSGNWSMQSASKLPEDSSTVSSHLSGGLHLQTILNSEDAPIHSNGPSTPVSAHYGSPTSSNLAPINQVYENSNRKSIDASSTSFLDSRRSSVDSRVNLNISQLAINTTTSPFESKNASQASLASSMQQQPRSLHTTLSPRSNGVTISSPPLRRPRTSNGQLAVRQAPQITANPRARGMPDPTASTPTKGYAWAFPDVKEDDETTSPASSRQGSFAPSLSSIHTTDSAALTHHHTMQHRSVTSLQGGDQNALGSGNYSRTPELRVSHKLAERKRRSEMKDLFDQLHKALPNPPGNKSSKWETLSKAIEYIKTLQDAYKQKCNDVDKLREENSAAASATKENELAQQEIHVMWQQLKRIEPTGHHVYGPKTNALYQQEAQTPGTRLPPLHMTPSQPGQSSQTWNSTGSNQMQGIEYASQSHFDRR